MIIFLLALSDAKAHSVVYNSVRTISECTAMAAKALTVIINFIDSRHLCGPEDLLASLKLNIDISQN